MYARIQSGGPGDTPPEKKLDPHMSYRTNSHRESSIWKKMIFEKY